MHILWILSSVFLLLGYGVIAVSLTFLNEAKVYRLLGMRLPISYALALMLGILSLIHLCIILTYLTLPMVSIFLLTTALFSGLVYYFSDHFTWLNKAFPYLTILNTNVFTPKERLRLFRMFRTLLILSIALMALSAFFVYQ